MPATTTTHEPWCVEHLGRPEGLSETCCTAGTAFGQMMTDRDGGTYERGSSFADQAEGEAEPYIVIEYAWTTEDGTHNFGFGRLDRRACQAIIDAIEKDLGELTAALKDTLVALEEGDRMKTRVEQFEIDIGPRGARWMASGDVALRRRATRPADMTERSPSPSSWTWTVSSTS